MNPATDRAWCAFLDVLTGQAGPAPTLEELQMDQRLKTERLATHYLTMERAEDACDDHYEYEERGWRFEITQTGARFIVAVFDDATLLGYL